MNVKKNSGIKKHSKIIRTNQYWLNKFNIKPVKVLLDKIKQDKKSVWTCFECFEFVHGTSEVVSTKSSTHICLAIEPSKKGMNLNAFKKFINNISSPVQLIPMKPPPSTKPPPPPPPPSPLFLSELSSENKNLSWAEMKSLVTKKYDVVQCSVELPKPVKQILKCAPPMAADKKAFISFYDEMNEELKMVLTKRGKCV